MSIELISTIKKDRIIATKAGNEQLKSFLGVVLGELDRNRGSKELDDNLLLAIIKKMRTSIKENIEIAKKSSHNLSEFEYQLSILDTYSPDIKTLDEAATLIEINRIIDQGANNIGAIMKVISGTPSIDKAIASKLAKQLLGGK